VCVCVCVYVYTWLFTSFISCPILQEAVTTGDSYLPGLQERKCTLIFMSVMDRSFPCPWGLIPCGLLGLFYVIYGYFIIFFMPLLDFIVHVPFFIIFFSTLVQSQNDVLITWQLIMVGLSTMVKGIKIIQQPRPPWRPRRPRGIMEICGSIVEIGMIFLVLTVFLGIHHTTYFFESIGYNQPLFYHFAE
jgi:hypothetical protein